MTNENPFAVQAAPVTPANPQVPRGPSPFAGIPISDYARDGAALTLLLVSFAMHWNFSSFATNRIEVILITLLSVFSLAITYLARTGVFPPSITVHTVWMLRLGANAPYVALVLTYMIIDAVVGASYVAGGIGFAAAFGLAGALVAAQPREAEVGTVPQGAFVGELWYRITAVIGSIFIVAGIVNLILVVARPGIVFLQPVVIVLVIGSVLLNLTAVVLLYSGVMRRSEVGRLVALAVGVIVLAGILVDLFTGFVISGGGVDSIHAFGYGAIALSAIAGLASSPGLRLAMHPVAKLTSWLRSASVMFVAIAGIAGFFLLVTILTLSSGSLGSGYTGFGIGTIVTVVAIGLVAIVARAVLRSNPATNRNIVLVLVGLLLLLGTVQVVLAAVGASVGMVDLVMAFGLPLAIGFYLTVPQAVRDYVRRYSPTPHPVATFNRPTFVEQLTGPIEPQTPFVPPAAPAVASDVGQALDPSTPAEVLLQLATNRPDLHPYLAANPATYPDLLTWLGTLDNPAVDEALRARGLK